MARYNFTYFIAMVNEMHDAFSVNRYVQYVMDQTAQVKQITLDTLVYSLFTPE